MDTDETATIRTAGPTHQLGPANIQAENKDVVFGVVANELSTSESLFTEVRSFRKSDSQQEMQSRQLVRVF